MKKYDANLVKQALIKKLEMANFEEITVTMKCNGDVLTITPCSYAENIKSVEDCDYFLVYGPSLPYIGGSSIDTVAENLANYEELLNSAEDEKREYAKLLKERGYWCKEKGYEDCFESWVSDWHKEIWGYRPRSAERLEQIIREYGA